MANIELLYKLIIRDEKGNIEKETEEIPAKSFTLYFLTAFWAMISHTTQGVKNILGVNQGWIAGNNMSANGASGNIYEGLVVGSDDTAEAVTDYTLNTQIAEGSAAGQLQYGLCAFNAPVEEGGAVDLYLTRTFVNNSGGNVTIKEMGFYMQQGSNSNSTYARCIIRDILQTPEVIADTKQLTVQYILRTQN